MHRWTLVRQQHSGTPREGPGYCATICSEPAGRGAIRKHADDCQGPELAVLMSLPRIPRSWRCLAHFQFDCQANTQRDEQDGERFGICCGDGDGVSTLRRHGEQSAGRDHQMYRRLQEKKEQHANLLKQLPEWLKRLQKLATHNDVAEDYKELTKQVREKVEEFNKFVKSLEKMQRDDEKRQFWKDFKTKLASFTEDMANFGNRERDLNYLLVAQIDFGVDKTLTIAGETHSELKVVNKTVAETHHEVKLVSKELAETHVDVKSGNKKLDETHDAVKLNNTKVNKLTKLVQMLVQMMMDPMFAHNLRDSSGAIVLFQVFELKGVLKDLQSRSDKQRREAKRNLVLIALKFVRDGNEQVGATGLMVLEKLIVDERDMRVVITNQSVVQTLLSWEAERSGNKTVQSMLEHLIFESKSFFEQLAHLSKDRKYHPAIASAALIPRIVGEAKPMVMEQERNQESRWEIGDEDALSVLVEIAKSSECKRAIAKAGGIAVLVEIYPLLKMTEYDFDATIVDVVSALAHLAEDARCQDRFVEDHGHWALLDFLWKCSTTATWINTEYDEERTRFNRATVLPAEIKAKRALLALAELGAGKRSVLFLGELYLESNNCDLDFDNPDALSGAVKLSPFDAIRGWVRMSNFIEEKQMWETERTYWCVSIVWSLLMDESTSFTAAEWYFGGSLAARRRCERAIFTVENTGVDAKPYIKWDLDADKKVKDDKLDAYSSDAESSGGDSSDAESSDEDSSDAESSDEEQKGEAVDRALSVDRANSQFISSICGYLELPRDKCKKLSTCLRQVLRALENDKTDKRAKALSVLWLGAGFMTIDSKVVDRLVKICKKVVSTGHEDEVFWATCLLSNMRSWPSVRKRSPKTRREMLELAASSVCVLLKTDEWPKYVFLAKFLVAKESDGMKSACIPFLVTFLKLEGVDDLPDDDDDSYFQSKQYRRSRPIKEKKLKRWCLWELEALWADHKSEITAEGGPPVLKAMLKSSEVIDDVKNDIKLVLKETTMSSVKEVAKHNLQDVAP